MLRRAVLRSSKAFTLIELLVVIAIIAILSAVVILTLNPAELLRQSRDSNRVSDMATMNSALGVYSTDQSSASSFNMGSSSVIYISIPDPIATSTAGDQCQGLGLPSLPTIYTYHCAASSTFRSINGTGWIPVNFSSISSGSPIGNLPIDPTNTTSSHFYYTYTTNGVQYETTAAMESAKYGVGGSNDVISSDGGTLASIYEKGTKLGLEPMDYGDSSLVGYWSMNEGTNTVAYDYSGNNATGSWVGAQVGTNGYYSSNAKVGAYAGAFDGLGTYIQTAVGSLPSGSSPASESMWVNINPSQSTQYPTIYSLYSPGGTYAYQMGLNYNASTSYSTIRACVASVCTNDSRLISPSQWVFLAFTFTGGNSGIVTPYVNGVVGTSTVGSTQNVTSPTSRIGEGNGYPFGGLIDDVRIYNRALSSAQISAMYTGGK